MNRTQGLELNEPLGRVEAQGDGLAGNGLCGGHSQLLEGQVFDSVHSLACLSCLAFHI